jgi:hypothetical protein
LVCLGLWHRKVWGFVLATKSPLGQTLATLTQRLVGQDSRRNIPPNATFPFFSNES